MKNNLEIYLNFVSDRLNTYYNWCYWNDIKGNFLLTDFKNSNAEFNRFKKHISKIIPKGKVKFTKKQYRKTKYMNILIKIKN